MLGVGRTRTLQRLIDGGALRTVQVGKRVRVPLAEVERFVLEGEAQPSGSGVRARRAALPAVHSACRPRSLAEELAAVRKIKI